VIVKQPNCSQAAIDCLRAEGLARYCQLCSESEAGAGKR
jgi:hypothetical protein